MVEKLHIFNWRRYDGYEVSSKGDSRFSALNARFPIEYLGGRTIEQIYQCCVKQFNPGGTNWKDYKGKPPLDPVVDLWKEYLSLWRLWSHLNIDLMRELYANASYGGQHYLSDMFANTSISQARALAGCLNELLSFKGPNPDVIAALESVTYKQLIYPIGKLKDF